MSIQVSEPHQLSNMTWRNRYPNILSYLAKRLQKIKNPKILSYGCSTGEECLTVKRGLPKATIIGVDVDHSVLEQARKTAVPGISFYSSAPENIDRFKPFRAVLAMSVFCRWPESKTLEDISSLYPFERFEASVNYLDSLMEEQGLLIIYNSNFRFCNCKIYEKYKAIGPKDGGVVNKFSKANQSLEDYKYNESIFF